MKYRPIVILVAFGILASVGAPGGLSQEQPREPKQRVSVAARHYHLSLTDAWEEHPDWSLAQKVMAPGRPFELSDCHAFLNKQNSAILQVCSDRNWLAGSTPAEVQERFLSPHELLPGRSFLAENLMAFFFRAPDDFSKQIHPVLAKIVKLATGRATPEASKDIGKYLVAYGGGQFAFQVPLEPRDLREFYSTFVSLGSLVIVSFEEKEKKEHIFIDVAFGKHRFASLGLLETPGRQWLGFILVGENTVSERQARQFELPVNSAGKSIRFIWFIGGSAMDFAHSDNLTHVVLAEIWDGSPGLGDLAAILRGLQLGKAETQSAGALSGTVEPNPWHVNEETWKAIFRLGLEHRLPCPGGACLPLATK